MNNPFILSIILSVSCALSGQERDSTEVALQYFMEGEFLLSQGNYALAILEFQEALEADPNGATIHVSIADAYRRLGKTKRAEKHLKKAIEIDPSDPEPYEILALLYTLEKKFDLAKSQFLYLLQMDPENSDYHFSLGDIARLNHRWVDAMDYYIQAYHLNSLATNALEQALQIAINVKDFVKAESICELLVDELPNNSKYWETYRDIALFNQHFSIAIDAVNGLMNIHGKTISLLLQKSGIYQRINDYKSSLTVLQHASKIDSLSQEVLQQYVSLFIDMEDYKKAIHYNSRLIKFFPESPKGYLNSAIISLSIKEPKKATDILIDHLDVLDQNFTALYILGTAYNQLKEYENSEQFLLKALENHPTSGNAKHTLAMVWDSMKKWEKSDSLYIELIQLDSNDAQAMNNYAYSLSERDASLDNALKYSLKAVELSPNSAPYLDTLGWIYFKLNHLEKALFYIENSIEIDSTNSVVIEHLGDIYMKTNQIDKAVDAYKQALKLDSGNPVLKNKIIAE